MSFAPLRADKSTRTARCLVVGQGGVNSTVPWLAVAGGFSRTWAEGSVGIIKDSAYGLSLALGCRLQRPTISPFSIPPPRQLSRKHLPRALQIPYRVRHRMSHLQPGPLPRTRVDTRDLPRRALERVRAQRRNAEHIGFHTRFTLCLSPGVKVLFQTGNTHGIIPQTEPSLPPSSFRRYGALQRPGTQA